MSLYHVYNQTVADGTATSVVRPSDWNSAHSQVMTLTGNTAGASTVSGTNIIFQGGNNVTLSANQAAGAATIVFSSPTQSVQTQASGNIAGAGFTSASTAGVNIVATHNSAGLSMGVPAYLTTAQPVGAYLTTARASNDAVGLNTALTANGVSWTVNSSGISLNVPAFLTTAAQSNHSHNFATTTTNGSQIVVGTANSAGATIGVPAFITTFAAQSADTNKAGTGFTSTTTAGTAVVATNNTAGLSMGIPAYITTYANDLTSGRAGTGFTSTTTAGTAIVATQNTAGLLMGVPAFITTYAAQTNQTANLYVSGNTTQLSSTAGLDLRSLSFEGAGIASVGVSNGRVLVSVPAGGGGGDGYNIVAMGTDPIGGGATSGATFSTLSGSIYLQAGNNMTLSQTSNSIVVSGADVKWNLVGNTAGTTSSNLSANQFYFSGGNNVTLSGNSNTIVVSAAAGGGGNDTRAFFDNLGPLATASGAMGAKAVQFRTVWFAPLEPFNGKFDADMTVNTLAVDMSVSGSTATMSAAFTSSVHVGLYTLNSTGNTLSIGLVNSVVGTFGFAAAATNNSTAFVAQRYLTIHSSQWSSQPVLTQGGRYIVGMIVDSAGASNQTNSILGGFMNSTAARSGYMGTNIAAATWQGAGQFIGHYSATSQSLPSQVNYTQVNKQAASANFIPHLIAFNYTNVTL